MSTQLRLSCRTVRPDDAQPLAQLFRALLAAGAGAQFHPHPLDDETARAVCAYEGGDLFCVAERDGAVLGYGMLRGWDEGYEVPSLGIAVDPASRGQGIGRALMAFLHSEARERGAGAIRLKVYPDNEPALRLYRALGYVFAGDEDGQLIGTLAL